MRRLNSISLMIMGTGFLILALYMGNRLLQAIVLILSMILNVMAIFRNFKEKKEKEP